MLGNHSVAVVVVHVGHAVLGLQSHGAGEELHELSKDVLVVGLGGVVYKHNTISVLLDGGPALLVAELSRNVPQFQVDFTKCRHAWWGASLEVNNSAAYSRSVNLRRAFLELANNVGNGALGGRVARAE